MTSLAELQANWDRLGEDDPLWAILANPKMRGNRWDEERFFASGREEIAALLGDLEQRGIRVNRGAALDFGCGVGRLTQALGDHFGEASGVDIAPSMVAKAEGYNRHGERCRYFVNGRDDLRLFPAESFDLVCSFIVLQHIAPRFAERYIREFVRVLRPGGVLVFQIPDRPAPTLKGWFLHLLSRRPFLPLLNLYRRVRDGSRGVAEMHAIPKARVLAILEECGAEVLACETNGRAGRTWISHMYIVSRP